ncbi:hypothetical protein AJ80_00108 [Polytolypa hystricis UAMH7299]|uniref:DNA endonuclease activator Ctp1 C-terminal domain-containing protein n=1 Tax=Polytolypa hystricis (strain UAMH7299) TaxID=1447883 RepID=A0A2B7Z512_POLH7|nr:hypothetical protein AJ80_00108 [Polytolypa hystricis UAMH7299]
MENSPIRLTQSPGAPLFPMSPDRINQQKIMTGSPTVSPERTPKQSRHGRAASEVQAKVAFLNSLASRTSSPTATSHPSSTATAALQRAILGREEAESQLQSAVVELSEANARERKVSERLESLMEELHTLKQRQVHERGVFEKEVRKARKEAFRAGSALVKAQEELKSSRSEGKLLRDQVRSEREAKDKARQEAFERAYALAGLTEELNILRDKVRSYENDNRSDVLEARAEEIRAETPTSKTAPEEDPRSYTPTPHRFERTPLKSVDRRSPIRKQAQQQMSSSPQLHRSPAKRRASRRASCKENRDPALADADEALIEELRTDLGWEKRMRLRAEDMVEFLKLECQFNRCSCRIAERRGAKYIYDSKWDALSHIKNEAKKPEQPVAQPAIISPTISQPERLSAREETEEPVPMDIQPPETIITFNPNTGTFEAMPSPERTPHADFNLPLPQEKEERASVPLDDIPQYRPAPRHAPRVCLPEGSVMIEPVRGDIVIEPAEDPEAMIVDAPESSLAIEPPPPPPVFNPQPSTWSESTSSSRPRPASLHIDTTRYSSREEDFREHEASIIATSTTSTTTTVPLLPENPSSSSNDRALCPIPGTPVTREQALAQIRARRNRTQQSVLKRSASANDASSSSRPRFLSTSTTPIRGTRRGQRVEKSEPRVSGGRARRDISAPIGGTRDAMFR